MAGPFLIVPESTMRALAGWLVGAESVDTLWPPGPAIDYILRSSMVAYLWIGVNVLVAARNPEGNRVQIDIAIGGLFLFAVVTLVTGLVNDLPYYWFLGDFISTLIGAVLLFLFRPPKAQAE